MSTYHRIASAAGRDYTGYLALPAAGSGPGVLVVPEVYGLVADVRTSADGLAAKGFVALAPDLFWEDGEQLEFAYSDRDSAAKILMARGGPDGYVGHIAPAFDALRELDAVAGRPVGVVGIGLGSGLALDAHLRGLIEPDAAVSFFAVRPDAIEHPDRIRAPWQFHFAGRDAVISAEVRAAAIAAFADVPGIETHDYPDAAHGFALAGRPEYAPAEAALAWRRAHDFLASALGLAAAAGAVSGAD